MRQKQGGARLRSLTPALVFGLLNCAGCEDPWPEPPASAAKYLAVVPNALDVYAPDPRVEVDVNVHAIVYDEFHRVIPGETVTFHAVSPPIVVKNLSALGDSATLQIPPATCPPAPNPCNPPPSDNAVKAVHMASGLEVEIPVVVRYDKPEAHGVAADPLFSEWPMVGLASGRDAGNWQRNLMQPFWRRHGFTQFISAFVPPPAGDAPSGTVLSSTFALWRKPDPWTVTPFDIVVPSTGNTAAPGTITLTLFFAGQDFPNQGDAFLHAAQGGADIIMNTLVGANPVVVEPVVVTSGFDWIEDCAIFGSKLTDPNAQPSPNYLAVYMVRRVGTVGGDRALHCPPGTLATNGPLASMHAIEVPEGGLSAATVAHEIGHALFLFHVTNGSGYYDDNLMVETDDAAAVLRFRFTLGQAFRAALDPKSFLVTSGQAKSTTISCGSLPMQCPPLDLDAMRRLP